MVSHDVLLGKLTQSSLDHGCPTGGLRAACSHRALKLQPMGPDGCLSHCHMVGEGPGVHVLPVQQEVRGSRMPLAELAYRMWGRCHMLLMQTVQLWGSWSVVACGN